LKVVLALALSLMLAAAPVAAKQAQSANHGKGHKTLAAKCVPSKARKGHKAVKCPPRRVDPLKGSAAALRKQNRVADLADFSRLNERQLAALKKSGALVPISTNRALRVDHRLKKKYRYVRPYVNTALLNLSGDFYSTFHHPLQINSAVRSTERQQQLGRKNGNAAVSKTGPRRSSHPTGATVDIAKIGLSERELRWLRTKFKQLERQNVVEATEEHRQKVFHVMFIPPKVTRALSSPSVRRPPRRVA